MEKMVLVISFDKPESNNMGILEDVLKALRPLMGTDQNLHVWAGIDESAQAVLDVIGTD